MLHTAGNAEKAARRERDIAQVFYPHKAPSAEHIEQVVGVVVDMRFSDGSGRQLDQGASKVEIVCVWGE
jgi:hypothetical protein